MSPAVPDLVNSLSKCKMCDPDIPVYSNTTGKPSTSATQLSQSIIRNLYTPLKMQTMFHIMYERRGGEGFPLTYHCGPGSYMLDMLRKVNLKAYNSSLAVTV